MVVKILQLNFFQGKYIDDVINFVKQNDIDILCLQEVTGGKFSRGGVNHYLHREFKARPVDENTLGIDSFEELKNKLSYDGLLTRVDGLEGSPESYFGNAILFKKEFSKIDERIIWLKDYEVHPNLETIDPAKRPRAATYLALEKNGHKLQIINGHLAWGPTPYDEDYKIEQTKKLLSFLNTIEPPFVITGDFNVVPETEIVKSFSKFGRNLTVEHGLKNTLNPEIHIAEELFPAGLAVDYIFVSNDIKVKNFKLIDEVNLSDHYGLLAEIEI